MSQKERHRDLYDQDMKSVIKQLLAGEFSREDARQSITVNRSKVQQVYKLWDGQIIYFDSRPQQLRLLDGTIINLPAYGKYK